MRLLPEKSFDFRPQLQVRAASLGQQSRAIFQRTLQRRFHDLGQPFRALVRHKSGVTDAQTITVTLHNVTDENAQVLPDTNVSAGILLGDTTGDGTVGAGDLTQTKSQSGHAVTVNNFREDVTIDGRINSADIALVKSRSGARLPQ